MSVVLDEELAHTFKGPARTRVLMPILRTLSPTVAGHLLAAIAVGDGIIRRRRFARALEWAGGQGYGGWARQRLALALLANHGRFIAQEAMLGLGSTGQVRAVTDVLGAERLEGLTRGAILLGMHVGPPRCWLSLRALGYPVRFVVRSTAGEGPLWADWLRRDIVVPLPYGDARGRVQGLYRIRRLLSQGEMVFLTADGPMGGELFRLELPGGSQVIRQGWFSLRRNLRVPTIPVLVHAAGSRRVVTIHPPLPEVDDDAERDAKACREALTPIMSEYVRQHPTQCRYLVFPSWG